MTYEEYITENLTTTTVDYSKYLDEPYSNDYIKYISENISNRINNIITRSEYELDKINNKLKYDRIEKLNELKQISENENE